jgi:signal transduction histidine kinase
VTDSRGVLSDRIPGFRAAVRRPRGARVAGKTAHVLPVLVPVVAVGALGITAATVSLATDAPSPAVLAGALGLVAAAALAEAFPLPIEGVMAGATSLATVFIVAAAVVYDWRIAAVVGFVSMASVELGRRKPLVNTSYNVSLYVCSAIAAALAAGRIGTANLGALVIAGFVASVAFYVVDIVLLVAVVTRVRRLPFLPSLPAYVVSTAVPFLIMGSLTVTLVVLWDRSPLVSVVLIGPLMTVALYERWLHVALARLREFDRLKDEFIAVISHELRTPLTSVYGAAVTLRDQRIGEDVRESLLEIVADEAGRLARLLDDTLTANRLDRDVESFEIGPVDAAAVAGGVVDAARSRVPPELALDLRVEDGLPRVAADRDKLRQVLVNLVENAIKYSPDGGRVTVTVASVDAGVRLTVADEGLGIPEREQTRIFDKFHRLDPNMTRGVGGTGLGLYICREFVVGMGGRISVESREGHGSRFSIELPAADVTT